MRSRTLTLSKERRKSNLRQVECKNSSSEQSSENSRPIRNKMRQPATTKNYRCPDSCLRLVRHTFGADSQTIGYSRMPVVWRSKNAIFFRISLCIAFRLAVHTILSRIFFDYSVRTGFDSSHRCFTGCCIRINHLVPVFFERNRAREFCLLYDAPCPFLLPCLKEHAKVSFILFVFFPYDY